MTPKSLLRLEAARSHIDEMAEGKFEKRIMLVTFNFFCLEIWVCNEILNLMFSSIWGSQKNKHSESTKEKLRLFKFEQYQPKGRGTFHYRRAFLHRNHFTSIYDGSKRYHGLAFEIDMDNRIFDIDAKCK